MGKSKLMAMPPSRALAWLVPGIIAAFALILTRMLTGPPALSLAIAVAGLIPSGIVFAWGTIKFRSYYEVKRTRHDYLTMINATLIQILALAVCAFLFVTALESYDSIMTAS